MRVLLFLLIALPVRAARTLDACDAKKLDASRWKLTSAPPWTVLLPASFRESPSKVLDVGKRWKSGRTFVYVVGGAEPFKPTAKKTKTYSECATEVDGKKAVAITTLKDGRYGVGLRFLDGPTSFIWGGEGASVEDQRLILNILRSAREKR